MNEHKFNLKLRKWCKKILDEAIQKNTIKSETLKEITITSSNIYTGSIPWWSNMNSDWHWKQFNRQIDLVIGIPTQIDNQNVLVPLLACELKLNSDLNSDELDKKSAIYGPLKEIYPLIHTVLIFNNSQRENEEYILRNARQFNTIYTSWDSDSKKLFKKLILQQLEYQLDYWKL